MAGIFRYKYDNLSVGTHDITYVASDGTTYHKTVLIKPFCDGMKYIKYLNHDGEYRFYPFNKFFEIKGSPKAIGTINKQIENILTAQSKERQIGYNNTKVVELTAENVTYSELEQLSDIYTSPCVYYYVGSGGDELKDWLQVAIKSKDNLYRKKKGNNYVVELSITLPESNTIKLL